MSIYPINKTWTGTSATWNNLALSCDDSVCSKQLARGTTGYIDFDVTTLIKDFVDEVKDDNGFMLACTTANASNSNGQFSFFYSSEYSSSEKRPMLTVEHNGGTSITPVFEKVGNIFSAKINKSSLVLNCKIGINGATMELININGKSVYKSHKNLSAGINSIKLPSGISSGSYLVVIKNNNIRQVGKVLVH